jgi:hypothetical protein
MTDLLKIAGVILLPVLWAASCASQSPQQSAMLADVDPIPLDSVAIGFEQLFSAALDTKEAAVQFNPRDDTVSLEFRYQTVIYRQYWDRAGRERFITAVQRYHTDFEARSLSTRTSASRRAYGSAAGRAEWGQFAFSVNARSYPRMDLGYRFRGNSPYFTVVQQEAQDTIMPSSDSPRMSLQITSYFTRAMADTLAALFDPQYLDALLEEHSILWENREQALEDPYF